VAKVASSANQKKNKNQVLAIYNKSKYNRLTTAFKAGAKSSGSGKNRILVGV
jgi:uncharacterized protein (DUF2126 family)